MSFYSRLKSLARVKPEGLENVVGHIASVINYINLRDCNDTMFHNVNDIVINLNEIEIPSVFTRYVYPKSLRIDNDIKYPDLVNRIDLSQLYVDQFGDRFGSVDIDDSILNFNDYVDQFSRYFKLNSNELGLKKISDIRVDKLLVTVLDNIVINSKVSFLVNENEPLIPVDERVGILMREGYYGQNVIQYIIDNLNKLTSVR